MARSGYSRKFNKVDCSAHKIVIWSYPPVGQMACDKCTAM